MEKIRNIILVLLLFAGATSCDQDELLTETPKDFLSPQNSFVDKDGFESALADIYRSIRKSFYAPGDSWANFALLGVDLDIMTSHDGGNIFSNQTWHWETLNADNEEVSRWWSNFYSIIFKANTIIGRADSDAVQWASDAEKNTIVGEAKFLRAFAYRLLANMWGGVPLVLEETTEPHFDYTRATQEEVYAQCKEDLDFAIKWMRTIDEVKGGMAPRAAAYHLMAEIKIQMGDYQGAIDAASAVINGGKFQLMKQRFGKLKDFQFNGFDHQGAFEPWGDVYWDLFREDNFNRIEGNLETIWNLQFDVAMEGGGNIDINSGGGNFQFERWLGPLAWNLKDKNGMSNYLKDTLGGRPVGSGTPTQYYSKQLWQFKDDSLNDIRNSKYNIQRTHYWVNPNGEFYGQPITMDNIGDPADFNPSRVGVYIMKNVTALHHGQFKDATSGETHDNGRGYKDWYIMRFAETYLLRAEAYYRNGDNANAANDINVIRNRAQATPVVPGDIDIDLILDERARELYLEEYRLNTLMRMNKLVEYLNKYHSEIVFKGWTIPDYVNKFPIPNSEIEANKDAVLEQNPGY